MISLNTTSPAPPKIPRLTSLQHRLRHAKDAERQPIPLLDELLFFLDDPPAGTRDRWQEGADLCASHGIETSRMAVWRFYRSHVLEWRRAQNPAPAAPAPSPEEIAQLHDQARHLAAQRVLETLHDPSLSPGHLIGLIQNDNHRQQIQLARDQFNDRLAVRRRVETKEHYRHIEHQVRDQVLFRANLKLYRKFFTTLLDTRAIPHDTTS